MAPARRAGLAAGFPHPVSGPPSQQQQQQRGAVGHVGPAHQFLSNQDHNQVGALVRAPLILVAASFSIYTSSGKLSVVERTYCGPQQP